MANVFLNLCCRPLHLLSLALEQYGMNHLRDERLIGPSQVIGREWEVLKMRSLFEMILTAAKYKK
eukprot:12083268-Ditylum_brightwellii.AAC.1